MSVTHIWHPCDMPRYENGPTFLASPTQSSLTALSLPPLNHCTFAQARRRASAYPPKKAGTLIL